MVVTSIREADALKLPVKVGKLRGGQAGIPT